MSELVSTAVVAFETRPPRADMVLACPGRLADLIEQGHCHLGDVEISVLDEADHMTDLGFLPVVRRILDMTPPGGQRMLFSATLDAAVDVQARRLMTRPAQHDVGAVEAPVTMVHRLLTVAPADRAGVVTALAGRSGRSLVFTRTKHAARRLARQLTAGGIPAAELHGDLSRGTRERNLASFAASWLPRSSCPPPGRQPSWPPRRPAAARRPMSAGFQGRRRR